MSALGKRKPCPVADWSPRNPTGPGQSKTLRVKNPGMNETDP